jgi:outer membrane receptor protein involved in Fe transport
VELSLAVNNLWDEDYYHPGVVDGGAGEDTTAASLSWYSSRLPQPGRNLLLTLKSRF